jgi:hypothetical protein
MKLPLTIVDSRSFTLNHDNMTCEISDLGNADIFRPIYDDACDHGFQIRSHRTGKIVTFYLKYVFRREGDITHWTFAPLAEDVRKNQRLAEYFVTVWND